MGPVSPFIGDASAPEHQTLGQSLFNNESFEAWTEAYNTNTFAPFFVTTAFTSLLQKGAEARGAGATSSVINVSSTTAALALSMNGVRYLLVHHFLL
jgi:NAD(P)-dependent dehydrogenase (short-subunit alcohol dehydrogenase family)